MIFTERQITVHKGKSSINEPVILYRGDYEVSITFTIIESKFRFKSGVNFVDTEKASHGQLAILAPYGGNVFSEIVTCKDGTVTFTLTKEMIDQLEEVGLYSFQIRLFDYYRESRVSIPPVEFGIEVREPVASEDHDNSVNNAIIGYSIAKVVDELNEDVPDTFDADGNYNKTDWETGDRITEGKLNKIEDAIKQINRNEINDNNALNKQMTSNFNVLQNQIDNMVIESGSADAEVEQARGEYNLLNQRLDAMDETDAELVSQLVQKANVSHLSINVKNYGAKGDGVSDDTEAFENALLDLKSGGCLFIPYGVYKIKDVEINYNNILVRGENSKLITNSFYVNKGIENITFENLTFVGELEFYKITEVLNNGGKILIENNPYNIGDTFTGSNFAGVDNVDNTVYTITDFDGVYYITDLNEKGFNGSPLREEYPMYVGNFDWSSILNFKGCNHNSKVINCQFENARGYSLVIPESNNIYIQHNIFKNNGRDFLLIGGMENSDCENITIENNIFDTNIDFGKQCIVSTNNGLKTLFNLNIRNNIFNKISESAISLKYLGCACDGVNIENNKFVDCDLCAVHILGKNININNNIFKNIDYDFARTKLVIGEFNNGNDINKNVVEFTNITIANNTFNKQGIDIAGFITSNSEHIKPKNIKIINNNIDIELTGLFLRCEDVLIENNNIIVDNTTNGNWVWSGLFIYSGCKNIKLLKNDFNGKLSLLVLTNTDTDNILFENNNFGNLFKNDNIIFGGANMQYPQTKILFKGNNFYKQTSASIILNTQEKTVFENNYYINDGVVTEIPTNLGSVARFADNESKTHWISNTNGTWLGQIYKVGYKTYRSSDLNTNYIFENGDVIFNTDFSKPVLGWCYLDGWKVMNITLQ